MLKGAITGKKLDLLLKQEELNEKKSLKIDQWQKEAEKFTQTLPTIMADKAAKNLFQSTQQFRTKAVSSDHHTNNSYMEVISDIIFLTRFRIITSGTLKTFLGSATISTLALIAAALLPAAGCLSIAAGPFIYSYLAYKKGLKISLATAAKHYAGFFLMLITYPTIATLCALSFAVLVSAITISTSVMLTKQIISPVLYLMRSAHLRYTKLATPAKQPMQYLRDNSTRLPAVGNCLRNYISHFSVFKSGASTQLQRDFETMEANSSYRSRIWSKRLSTIEDLRDHISGFNYTKLFNEEKFIDAVDDYLDSPSNQGKRLHNNLCDALNTQ